MILRWCRGKKCEPKSFIKARSCPGFVFFPLKETWVGLLSQLKKKKKKKESFRKSWQGEKRTSENSTNFEALLEHRRRSPPASELLFLIHSFIYFFFSPASRLINEFIWTQPRPYQQAHIDMHKQKHKAGMEITRRSFLPSAPTRHRQSKGGTWLNLRKEWRKLEGKKKKVKKGEGVKGRRRRRREEGGGMLCCCRETHFQYNLSLMHKSRWQPCVSVMMSPHAESCVNLRGCRKLEKKEIEGGWGKKKPICWASPYLHNLVKPNEPVRSVQAGVISVREREGSSENSNGSPMGISALHGGWKWALFFKQQG